MDGKRKTTEKPTGQGAIAAKTKQYKAHLHRVE